MPATENNNARSSKKGILSADPLPLSVDVLGKLEGILLLEQLKDGYEMPEKAIRIDDREKSEAPIYAWIEENYLLLHSPEAESIEAPKKTEMFSYLPSCGIVCFPGIGTDDMTDMSGMFCENPSLLGVEGLPVSSKVTSMAEMFRGDRGLICFATTEQSDFSGVKDMSMMFAGCESLVTVGMDFHTAAPENVRGMFIGCRGLHEIDLSGMSAKNLKADSVSAMFAMTDVQKVILNSEMAELAEFMDMPEYTEVEIVEN